MIAWARKLAGCWRDAQSVDALQSLPAQRRRTGGALPCGAGSPRGVDFRVHAATCAWQSALCSMCRLLTPRGQRSNTDAVLTWRRLVCLRCEPDGIPSDELNVGCSTGLIELRAADGPADGDAMHSGDDDEEGEEAVDAATAAWRHSTCAPTASYVLERKAPATLARLEDAKRFHADDTAEIHQLKKVPPPRP